MSFANLAKNTNAKVTIQIQPAPTAPVLQVKNNAGGFVFQISPEKQLDRFLIAGVSGGTFYQGERDLTKENTDVIKALIQSDGGYVIGRVIEVSSNGRARNNDYALLVLAMCFAYGDAETKASAKSALPIVARTGTHLMHFTQFANNLRGWGSSLKKAVANWYLSKKPSDVAYQAIKYQSRDGWSQRDILRLAHPKTLDEQLQNTFKYITKGFDHLEVEAEIPAIISAFESAKTAAPKQLVKLITDHRLSMEMIPTEARNRPEVWEALLPNMGATALIRNLNKLTSVGLIKPLSETSKLVNEKLHDREWLRKARIHPLQLLVANKVYAAGKGILGSLVWTPDQNVVAALEDAFYLSFDMIVPSGRKSFKAIDVSGSMNSPCSGAPQISCREGAAVLAMVSLRAEPDSVIYGFDHEFRDLGITRNDNLATVCNKTYSRRFASTDCSKPIVHATQNNWDVDQFEIYTDNETYYGDIHPFEAIKAYRSKSGKKDAKLAVVAMTASMFSIANPKDENMIDLVGFDTATPALLSDFAAGLV